MSMPVSMSGSMPVSMSGSSIESPIHSLNVSSEEGYEHSVETCDDPNCRYIYGVTQENNALREANYALANQSQELANRVQELEKQLREKELSVTQLWKKTIAQKDQIDQMNHHQSLELKQQFEINQQLTKEISLLRDSNINPIHYVKNMIREKKFLVLVNEFRTWEKLTQPEFEENLKDVFIELKSKLNDVDSENYTLLGRLIRNCPWGKEEASARVLNVLTMLHSRHFIQLDFDKPGPGGCTPLYYAVNNKFTKHVEMLMAVGANSDCKATNGKSPMQRARELEFYELVAIMNSRP